MMKKFILALVCLLAPLGARATTVTGNLKDVGVANFTGSNSFVRFTLANFGNNIPRVSGQNVVARPFVDLHPDINGNILGSIQGNDTITPAGTIYEICIFDGGTKFKCNNYLVTGTTFDLSTAVPIVVAPTVSGNILFARTFLFNQATPSLVWVITHSFGDSHTFVQCADGTGQQIFPDTVQWTSINVTTVTWVVPTAGTCILMTDISFNISAPITGSILSNPSAPQTVNNQPLTIQGQFNAVAGGSFGGTFSGNPNFTGNLSSSNLNGTLYVDGVKYATLAAAFADCPSSGCTIDMRGNSSALALGTFDPGAKAVTLLLGPFTYTVNQIVLEPNLHIIGVGSGSSTSGPATKLQAIGSNSTHPIVATSSTTQAMQDVILRGFWLQASVGNTSQNGISLIAAANGGLWYSEFDDILINGFKGISMNLDAQLNSTIHQFSTFKRIVAFRPNNGSYALQIIGRSNSLKFENCQFDGIFNTQDGLTNINIAQGTNTVGVPYNIKFDLLTDQYAGVGMSLSGADSVSIDQGHFEAVQGVLLVGTGSSFGSINITMHDGGAFTNSGIGTVAPGLGVGNGYIVNVTAAAANASVGVVNFHAFNTPDRWVTGTGAGSVSVFGSSYGPEGSFVILPPQSLGRILTVDSNNIDNTGLTANVGSTPMLNVPSSATLALQGITPSTGRNYMVCGNTTVTTPASVSSTLPSVAVSYTDRDNSASIVGLPVSPGQAAAGGVPGQSTNSNQGNTLSTISSGCVMISVLAGTTVSYSTGTYASSGGTAMQYTLHIRVTGL